MKTFLLFLTGLIALIIAVTMIGPMILLGVSVWLLFVIFKQFMKSGSTLGKIGWLIAGLIVLSMGLSNLYAVIGAVAIYAVYKIFTSLKKENGEPEVIDKDPFTNFEKEWAEMNRY